MPADNNTEERPQVVVMANRKLIISIVGAVLLFAAALIFYDTRLIKSSRQAAGGAPGAQTGGVAAGAEAGGTLYRMESGGELSAQGSGDERTAPEGAAAGDTGVLSAGIQSGTLINEETVEVGCNSPEYELELKLCENSEGKTFIRLKYYLNGEGTLNELGESDIPELTGIFEKRSEEAGGKAAFNISQALLNPVHAQLYMLIHEGAVDNYARSSLYLVGLKDMSVRRLFSYQGIYGEMVFDRNYGMLAYSFKDPPHLSNLQEDELVEVFDCGSGEFIIRASKDKSGQILGKNSSAGFLYDYRLESWHSADVLKLSQFARSRSDLNSAPAQRTVLYDIKKNLLLDTDGSELKPTASGGDGPEAGMSGQQAAEGSTAGSAGGGAAGGSGTAAEGAPAGGESAEGGDAGAGGKIPAALLESEPVKILKSFYSYLASENDYSKAMDLLDDDFVLRLDMLEQFGADEISKSDIDTETASLYSQLLKTAVFDTITNVDIKSDSCVATYYQIFGRDADSQVRQLMTAKLSKSGSIWKIVLIEDEDEK